MSKQDNATKEPLLLPTSLLNGSAWGTVFPSSYGDLTIAPTYHRPNVFYHLREGDTPAIPDQSRYGSHPHDYAAGIVCYGPITINRVTYSVRIEAYRIKDAWGDEAPGGKKGNWHLDRSWPDSPTDAAYAAFRKLREALYQALDESPLCAHALAVRARDNAVAVMKDVQYKTLDSAAAWAAMADWIAEAPLFPSAITGE